jgi:hypothetical protein
MLAPESSRSGAMAGIRGEARNDEDVTTVRQMAAAGAALPAIAAALERTQDAVSPRARRLKIKITD